MPEIKKQFTGGKMNKDVDERLVPNGEYRHAMNIQVTTSEGSEVGTIQNVLGNSSVCVNKVPEGSFTVGSISDEKNDTLYWLVSGQSYDASEITSNNFDWTDSVTMSDSIWRHTPSGCEAVFVDNFAISQPNELDENSNQLTNISSGTLAAIEQGWTVQGVNSNGTSSNISTINSIGNPQGYDFTFGFEPEASTNTFTYLVDSQANATGKIGDSILIPFTPGSTGSTGLLSQQTGSVVYISEYTGGLLDLVGAKLVFNNVTSLNLTDPFEIITAVDTIIYDTSGNFKDVTKLTLNNNLPLATNLAIAQPTAFNVGFNPPYSGTNSAGDAITASISFSTTSTNNYSNGHIHFDPLELDVDDLNEGDALGFDFTNLSGGSCVLSINSVGINNYITVGDCDTEALADGFQVGGSLFGTPQPTGGVVFFGADSTVWLNDDLNLSNGYEALVFTGPRTLNFNHSELVTGINIVDDMLFWTDNKTEPKKINIPRSIEGTDTNGFSHTRLINSAQEITFSSNILAREKHITVIRKAPTKPPTLVSLVSNREYDGTGLATSVLFNSSTSSIPQLLEPTDSLIINIYQYNDTLPTFLAGDIILLNNEVSGQYPPENYEVRAVVNDIEIFIESVPVPSGTTAVDDEGNPITEIDVEYYSASITIISISPETSNLESNFYVSVEKQGKKLFDRKFPRFAYRYKYKDGEYSSIGPFSEVAFIPGHFSYHPTEAYNKGMVNNLRSLTLKDFIPYKIPKDVVQVDLLYKDEASPNIYLVKSITPQDSAWSEMGSGVGSFGSYDITTENIYAVLPSNQGLRLWDNVPRLALAQEVTGNRVVYANYLQGYNLQTLPAVTASLNPRFLFNGGHVGAKSLKSLRTYNVGIVYGDKYGRETPVFANSESNQIVPKLSASTASFLKAKVTTAHPSWATYYKFYVKETSNEYYNLALGRTYDAKDGNIWLAFPSIDRNKVDEDTYLILKKGLGNVDLSGVEAKYKIVAIENEAPDYIKTNFTTLARPVASPDNRTYAVFGASGTGNIAKEPRVGVQSFYIDVSTWTKDVNLIYGMGMPYLRKTEDVDTGLWEERGSSELWVNFIGTIEGSAIASQKYLITDIKYYKAEEAPYNALAGGTDRSVFEVFISTPLKPEDDWISNTPGKTIYQTKHRPVIYKKEVINKPEFDGRFFVKIKNDEVAEAYLTPTEVTDTNYKVAASRAVYYMRDRKAFQVDYGTSGKVKDIPGITLAETTNHVHAGNTSSSKSDFEKLLGFGLASSAKSGWFIDQIAYAGWQSSDAASVSEAYTNNTYSDLDSYQIYTRDNGSIGSNYGTGFSRGTQWQKGLSRHYDTDLPNNTKHELVLSYSGIDFGWAASKFDVLFNGPTNQSWEVGTSGNSYEADQADFVSKIREGSKFRMGQDLNKTYTITSVSTKRVYNYRATLPEPYLTGSYFYHGNPTWSKEAWWIDWTKRANNRRLAFTIVYTIDGGDLANDLYDNDAILGANATTSANFQFLEPFDSDKVVEISRNPAIFETEPKEDLDLDIYYEASGRIPTSITSGDGDMMVPVGATMRIPPVAAAALENIYGSGITAAGWGAPTESALGSNLYTFNHSVLKIQPQITGLEYVALRLAINPNPLANPRITFDNPDGSISYVRLLQQNQVGVGLVTGFLVEQINEFGLGWFNCWSFGNGVESNRVGDTFNKPFLLNGAKASTTLDKKYEKEERKYGLIYSGIYNSTSGVNSLNQFIAAEKITKDINPTYGSIQKLHSGWGQDGDLIALCEDRVLKILADKDALFNADGNPQLTSTNNVLGQAIPYSGDYGISKNPESFASEAYRIYFTDKVRGAVMRLSMDGLTPISDHGMKDWFKDNLKLNNILQGSYDDKKDEYNLTLKTNDPVVTGESSLLPTTVSFREDVKGWVSFKSFTPENAISCANEYYSFKDGDLWLHHVERFKNNGLEVGRNTFYNAHRKSSFTVILNDAPGSVKSFNTVNYEGSQSRVKNFTTDLATGITDGEYHNLSTKKGWWVDSIFTNKESGTIPEFIEKEGKWFNYIRGKAIQHRGQKVFVSPNGDSTFDQDSFSTQGFGALNIAGVNVTPQGCTDNAAFNYDQDAIINDGSCIAVVNGCTEPTSFDYDPVSPANTDNGSCRWFGCTDLTASNPTVFPDEAYAYLNGNNILDDLNTCEGIVYGCTDPNAFNYNINASTDDGSCVAIELGCTRQYAHNESSSANTDDGSCVWYGCTEPLATNYGWFTGNLSVINTSWPSASVGYNGVFGAGQQPIAAGGSIFTQTEIDLATCQGGGCTDLTASNYDATATFDDGSCQFCDGFTVVGNVIHTWPGQSNGSITPEVTGGTAPYYYSWSAVLNSSFTETTGYINNLAYDVYTVEVTEGTGCTTSWTNIVNEQCPDIPGCMDPTADNYGGAPFVITTSTCYATIDDGSCIYTTLGCTDLTANNYDINASTDDGSCTYDVLGCTALTATNYDSLANTDDGSCIINGCTDNTAFNYDSIATTDDGTCTYNCPTLDSYILTANLAPGKVVSVAATYNISGTTYSQNLTGGGIPVGLAVSRVITGSDNNGNTTTLYTTLGTTLGTSGGIGNNNTAGWSNGGPNKNKNAVAFSPDEVEGLTGITLESVLYTNDGSCNVSRSDTYTVGCTDPTANNYSAFNIPDPTQCT